MSTRSTYRVRERFIDEKTKKEVTKDVSLMYVQCDGYPSGHPAETAEWLASGKVVNGIGMDAKGLIFNGAGCLAAQLVAKYKDGAGGTYMHNLRDRGKCGEDYTYDIIVDYGEDQMKPQRIIYAAYECGWKSRPKKIWEGNPKDFAKFVAKTK